MTNPRQEHMEEYRRSQTALGSAILIATLTSTLWGLRSVSEGTWAPLDALMNRPATMPITGHRLLFVAVAWLPRMVMPGMSAKQCYFFSQVIALIFTFLAMRKWSLLFLPVRSLPIVYMLLAVTLIPTFRYYTFYDIAMVGFFALTFELLFTDRLVLLALVFALGLSNHENILLIVPIVVLHLFRTDRRAAAGVMALVLIALYGVYRTAVHHFLPGDTAFVFQLPANLHPMWLVKKGYRAEEFGTAAVSLFPPLFATAVTLRLSPRELQTSCILLFLELLVVTAMFGKFNEARQFTAFFSVSVLVVAYGTHELLRRDLLNSSEKNDRVLPRF
jgi:hypothetical protein